MQSDVTTVADEAAALSTRRLPVQEELDALVDAYASVISAFEGETQSSPDDAAAYARLAAAGERAMQRVYRPGESQLLNWDRDSWPGKKTGRASLAARLRQKQALLLVAVDEAKARGISGAAAGSNAGWRKRPHSHSSPDGASTVQWREMFLHPVPLLAGVVGFASSVVTLVQAPWGSWLGAFTGLSPLLTVVGQLIASIAVGVLSSTVVAVTTGPAVRFWASMKGDSTDDARPQGWAPYLAVGVVAAMTLALLWFAGVKFSGQSAGAGARTEAGSVAASAPATPSPSAKVAAVPQPLVEAHPLKPKTAAATSTVKERRATDYEIALGRGEIIEHKAYQLIDTLHGEPKATTAWMADGDGIGETITVTFSREVVVNRIQIIPGYWKTIPADEWELYPTTPSVKTLTVSIDDGSSFPWQLEDLRSRDKDNKHLLSTPVPQSLQKPTKSVRFTINAIYPASKNPPHGTGASKGKNTAISMLRFYGWEATEIKR